MPQSREAGWEVALFNRSVLKQAKYHSILELLQDPAGKISLNIRPTMVVMSTSLTEAARPSHTPHLIKSLS